LTLQFDLIRDILSHVDQHRSDAWIDMWIEGYDNETVSDCVKLLDRQGYVNAVSASTIHGDVWKSVSLTGKGGDFLANSRHSAAWERALIWASQKGEGCELDEFQAFLAQLAEEIERTQ
jgi:hypothetical protein